MFTLKYPEKINELLELQPEVLIVFGHFCRFATDRKLPIIVTNILEDAKGSKSKTHSTARALDISSKGWDLNQIAECLCYVRSNVGYLGAISATTNQPNVIMYHAVEGGEFHFHMQTKPVL